MGASGTGASGTGPSSTLTGASMGRASLGRGAASGVLSESPHPEAAPRAKDAPRIAAHDQVRRAIATPLVWATVSRPGVGRGVAGDDVEPVGHAMPACVAHGEDQNQRDDQHEDADDLGEREAGHEAAAADPRDLLVG